MTSVVILVSVKRFTARLADARLQVRRTSLRGHVRAMRRTVLGWSFRRKDLLTDLTGAFPQVVRDLDVHSGVLTMRETLEIAQVIVQRVVVDVVNVMLRGDGAVCSHPDRPMEQTISRLL
jgi:hypothetical protein